MHLLLLLALVGQPRDSEYGFRHIIDEGEENGGFFITAILSIPYSSLQFTRDETTYKANYHILFQLIDRKKNLYGTELFGDVAVSTTEEVRSRNSIVTETLKVVLPQGKYNANLTLEALEASRRVEKSFEADIHHRALGSLKLTDTRGERMLNRPFTSTDTLMAEVALYEEDVDSLLLEITSGGPISYRDGLKRQDSVHTWEIPLVKFTSAEYTVSVSALSGRKSVDERRTGFSIKNPFRFEASRYNELVDKLVYITTYNERARLKRVPADRRQAVWDSFWQSKDPTPNTEYNEVMEEYFLKIDYCETNFSGGDRGYMSDRARVYMEYGEPDEVEDHPFEPDRPPYIIWVYYQNSMEFIFEDRLGFGEYILVYPPETMLPASGGG